MVRRAVLFVGALLPLTFSLAAHAGGWQEMHETSDDVRVELDKDGVATVSHHLRYRIVAGHFKTFEIAGIDPRAEVMPEAVISKEKDGSEVAARVEVSPKSKDTIRVMIDEGKGLTRGAYVFDVKYKLNLVATKMLTRDGAMWKVAWTAPPAPEGHDGARVIFDLPTAPTEPRIAGANETSTTLVTLRRGGERDELELVRAHVPRGEAVTWMARLDPKALPAVVAPELRPTAAPEVGPPSLIASNLSRIVAASVFAAITGILAMLLRAKQGRVRSTAEARAATARPLVPVPLGLAPFAYGVTMSGALAALLWWSPVVGAVLVAVAMALATHRAPVEAPRMRSPGAWRPVSDHDVLLPKTMKGPSDAFDVGSFVGKLTLVLLALGLVAAAWLLRRHVPQIAVALPIVATALVPIFVTGTRAQLAPVPMDLAARVLRPVRDALSSKIDLTHVELSTIGRVVAAKEKTAGERIDELRLACAPRDRMPGLRSVELALATSSTSHGAVVPEVLVRFEQGSSVAARMARLAPATTSMPGRAREERVVRLYPEEPTAPAMASMLADLLGSLEGRRDEDRGTGGSDALRRGRYRGPERRASRRTVALGGLAPAAT